MIEQLGKEVSRGKVLSGSTLECIVPCGKLYITANSKNGEIREVFLTLGKGGCMTSHLNTMAILTSLYLSSGGKIDKIIKKTEKLVCNLSTPDKPGCFQQIAQFLRDAQKELEVKRKELPEGDK